MKLTEEIMQSLHELSSAIAPQPACAFTASDGAHSCGGCSGDCMGGGFAD